MNWGGKSERSPYTDPVTSTSSDQIEVEELVDNIYSCPKKQCLYRDNHIQYLKKQLFQKLKPAFACLDASRPWMVYWTIHSLELLNVKLTPEEGNQVIDFLSRCQSPEGGFGGGPGQFPHLAPTYAAVNSLVIIGTKEAYDVINREKLMSFLYRMKQPNGGFTMHEGGEVDIRGIYCALSAARLTNIFSQELFQGTPEWVVSCQTYEGGFSGSPGLEAHGGYTFCGLAALALLGKRSLVDTKSLLRWAVNRQMRFEGGFQGRTNKLVDGCYSFWIGGLFPILQDILSKEEGYDIELENWLFHQEALQTYLLLCCQSPSGGLLDKPGKKPDSYHTCYTLSGMSVAQHFCGSVHKKSIVGNSSNLLCMINPVFNVGVDEAKKALMHFQQFNVPKLPETAKD